jgi:hypothetical protein
MPYCLASFTSAVSADAIAVNELMTANPIRQTPIRRLDARNDDVNPHMMTSVT